MQPFKILVWNCRGLNNTETQDALVNMVRRQNPSIVFLSETLAAPPLLDKVKRQLGFDGVICAPVSDNCRGLALLWRKEALVRPRLFSTNFIDVEVGAVGGRDTFRLTGIYGFAATGDREQTWEMLRMLARQSSMAWVVAGDFNEILCQADKSGGPLRSLTQITNFRQAFGGL